MEEEEQMTNSDIIMHPIYIKKIEKRGTWFTNQESNQYVLLYHFMYLLLFKSFIRPGSYRSKCLCIKREGGGVQICTQSRYATV